MTYRPLPECLTIKKSDIHGLGIFATCDIEKDTDLGIAHVEMVEWLNFPQGNCRTPLGGFYNHSDPTNCILVDCSVWKRLVTIKNIKKGEEITCKYTFYEVENV